MNAKTSSIKKVSISTILALSLVSSSLVASSDVFDVNKDLRVYLNFEKNTFDSMANQTFLIGSVNYIDGKIGSAIEFNENSYIRILDNLGIEEVGDGITISFWFKKNSPDSRAVFSYFYEGNYQYFSFSDEQISTDWGMYTIIFNNKGQYKLYTNGKLSYDFQEWEFLQKIWDNNGLFEIGIIRDNDKKIVGDSKGNYMDEFRIYSREFSEEDVYSLYTFRNHKSQFSGYYSGEYLEKLVNDTKDLCFNNPNECGIELPNENLKYTQIEFDNAIEDSKVETKLYCEQYPFSCGIEPSSVVSYNTNTLTLNKNEWHMIGVPTDIEIPLEELFPIDCVGSIVWKYLNGSWESAKLVKSGTQLKVESLDNGTETLKEIGFANAIWIYPETNCKVDWSIIDGSFKTPYENLYLRPPSNF